MAVIYRVINENRQPGLLGSGCDGHFTGLSVLGKSIMHGMTMNLLNSINHLRLSQQNKPVFHTILFKTRYITLTLHRSPIQIKEANLR